MKTSCKHLIVFSTWLAIASCSKKEFLEAKPDSDIFVPTTLEDFQSLLDQDVLLSITPSLGESSADNFYLTSTLWNSLTAKEQNAYIWARDIFNGEGKVPDWNSPYEQVLYANVVLDGLGKAKATPENQTQWNMLKGYALFIRAYAFYNLAQVFALPYDPAINNLAELGIPLKLSPNVDEKVKRSTLAETYSQIENDLRLAKDLLPTVVTNNRSRPNKPAALAQLARVYLSMRKYDEAGKYADSCLLLYGPLINYNTKDVNAPRPFEKTDVEIIYQSKMIENSVLKAISIRECIVDSNLYNSYATSDLRRLLFFNINAAGKVNFKGGYNGTIFAFSGLATDEMYLVRAECRARNEDATGAMQDLNTLLQQRFKTGTFVPYSATNSSDALRIILEERRKEMPCRGVRWTDIRRLNLDNAGIKLKRVIDGQVYELPANSPRYALPIPPDALILGGYKENER